MPFTIDPATNGRPWNELAKHDTTPSSHQHDDHRRHDHGDPAFTDQQVAEFERRGWHVDRDHGVVTYEDGVTRVPPSTLAQVTRDTGDD